MIVGHGLIATAFAKKLENEIGLTVFASGVSNSSETRSDEFARESACLTQAMADFTGVFVYFSTCSVGDHERQNSLYVQHKKRMEKLVSRLPQYIIFRLPQVVGRTSNPHTLTNYIHTQILLESRLTLWKNAWRNIIDVDDIVGIAEYMIREPNLSYMCEVINIASPSPISILNLVEIFERLMNKKAHYDLIERGDHYNIDIESALCVANKLGIEFGSDYTEKVIEKYYGKENSLD